MKFRVNCPRRKREEAESVVEDTKISFTHTKTKHMRARRGYIYN